MRGAGLMAWKNYVRALPLPLAIGNVPARTEPSRVLWGGAAGTTASLRSSAQHAVGFAVFASARCGLQSAQYRVTCVRCRKLTRASIAARAGNRLQRPKRALG